MSQNSADETQLNAALRNIFPHLRDVSIRDGIQSWDGNKWQIDDILLVAKELNQLAKIIHETLGITLPPVEAWGGGQVAQPAKFLKENPFENLRRIHAATPDLQLQCLYRGRQGVAFIPISAEVQEGVIRAAIDNGMRVFRVFDMMKDLRNYDASTSILNQYKKTHANILTEGAIPYISAPVNGPRAWELSDYAALAVQLAEQGYDEIVIKDYAGVVDDEVSELMTALRAGLDAAGYQDKKINLHSHGNKPDILIAAMNAGADKVDVAIGELAGGPSHTNMREMIYKMLDGKFTPAQIAPHPVMQQLAKVETIITQIVHDPKKSLVDGKSFYDLREFLRTLDYNLIKKYRVAAGALSDLSGRVQSLYPKNPQKAEVLFYEVLDKTPALWRKAGQFDTVTPGAKIIIDQAVAAVMKSQMNKAFTMADYRPEYLDIIIGRYGNNQGMEKPELDNLNFRDAALMYRALKTLNRAIENNQVSARDFGMIFWSAGLGVQGNRLRIIQKNNHKLVDLDYPELEITLMTQDGALAERALERFRAAITAAGIADDIKTEILSELEPGRSPDPTNGIAGGTDIIHELLSESCVNEVFEREEYALLALALRNRNADGRPDDTIIAGLLGDLPCNIPDAARA